MVALLIAGILGYRALPLSALPEVDYPTIQVTTFYPGASPEVMTSNVTAPLERQFGQIPGLAQMSSVSSAGVSLITLRFALEIALDSAEQEVQAAINSGSALLPNDLPSPPIYNKVNPAVAPILTLALTSPTLPQTTLNDLAENRLAQKLSQINGVGMVSIAGGQRPAVRIQVDPMKLSSLKLSLEDLRNVIVNANVNQAKGSFDGAHRAFSIDANDQLKNAEEYRTLIIAYKNGNAIRLGDVAQAIFAPENIRLAAWSNTTPAIIVNIQKQPGANVIATVDRIQKALPTLIAALPESVEVSIASDRTITIRASVRAVQWELIFAVFLVVLVNFVFLRNLWMTLIPSIAVPLSLIGTFAVMVFFDFSINNLTLMALTIASGFVVDDAIVVVENITRYIEEGESPLNASLKGSAQIGFTIISLTLSLIAVLIPLLFMGEVVGRLFHEFAITLAVSILISMGVSLTLTPMLCAKLIRPSPVLASSDFLRRQGEWINRLIAFYLRCLDRVLSKQGATMAVFAFTVIASIALYGLIPKGFFPLQDTALVQAITVADSNVSFAKMREQQSQLAQILLRDSAVRGLISFIGVDGHNLTLNSGRMMIRLHPQSTREPIAEVLQRLKASAQAMSGMKVYLQAVQDLTIEDNLARGQYQMSVTTPLAEELSRYVPMVLSRLQKLPQINEVTSDLQDNGLQAFVDIDRSAAGRLGVSVSAIDAALYNAFGQRMISTIFTQSNQYRVILEIAQDAQQGLSRLNDIDVTGTNGQRVPLSSLAKISERLAPLSIAHLGQFPAATVSFNLASGVSLGEAVSSIRQALSQEPLPASVEFAFQGAADEFQSSLSSTLLLILAAIVTMYIVLGVLYESLIHPLTILSTLPSAGIGALLALMLYRMDLGMIGMIGIILLIGLVKKNAIMMVDFALSAERQQGLSAHESIRQACALRFRPILMTTLTAIFGALPLMLGSGVGSELRQPLGVAMVGGLIVSQLLTLFTTPVIYLQFSRLSKP